MQREPASLWLAARSSAPAGGELYFKNPLRLTGVLALAPITDLAAFPVHNVTSSTGRTYRLVVLRFGPMRPLRSTTGRAPVGNPSSITFLDLAKGG